MISLQLKNEQMDYILLTSLVKEEFYESSVNVINTEAYYLLQVDQL